MEYSLITGASSGIGLELAKIMANRGHNLVLVARSEEKLKDLKKELEKSYNVSVKVIVKDLSLPDSAEEVYNKVKDLDINILVNNAGFGDYGEFSKSDLKKIESMMNLNMLTLVKLTHLILNDMVKRNNGRIMNVGSTASFQPVPYFGVYSATKAFVLSFSESLRYELRNTGISVTTLCPGATISGFQEKSEMEDSGFMRNQSFATSRQVAEFGYNSLMIRQDIAVHGLLNKLVVLITKFLPRDLVVSLAARVSK